MTQTTKQDSANLILQKLQQALALHQQGQLAPAESIYREVLAIDPNQYEALHLLGLIAHKKNNLTKALELIRKAIDIYPNAVFYSNYGVVLQELGKLDEALAAQNKAAELKPGYPAAYYNRGIVLQELRRLDDAVANYDKAIELKPDYALAHWNKSTTLLLMGEYSKGWELYEWRWKENTKGVNRSFQKPLWLGEKIPSDKTILLHSEQGFGDNLQFCRYIPWVAKTNKVIFECPRALVSFMQFNFPDVKVIDKALDYPGIKGLPEHDYHTPLMSLPHAFGTTLETIPSEPYLKAQPELVEKWRAILGEDNDSLRIGLCWAGGPRPDRTELNIDLRRSLTFKQIKPLLDVANVSFISLQLGPPKDQMDDKRVKDFSSQIDSWSDTAAIISLLDLVVSVDTSVCHIAGAMGKKTFLLNRYDTCWRWLLDRDDSPWYPSLTQFRQKAPGAWDDVIDQAKNAITNYLR